jgi:hypothetical protein
MHAYVPSCWHMLSLVTDGKISQMIKRCRNAIDHVLNNQDTSLHCSAGISKRRYHAKKLDTDYNDLQVHDRNKRIKRNMIMF